MQTRSWLGYGCCSPVKMRSLANVFVRFSPKKRDPRLEPTNSCRRSGLCGRVGSRRGRVGLFAHSKSTARRSCAPILPPQNGYLFHDEGEVPASFAGSVLPAVDGSSRMRGRAYSDDVLRDTARAGPIVLN